MNRSFYILLVAVVFIDLLRPVPLAISAQTEARSPSNDAAVVSGVVRYSGRVPKPSFDGFSDAESEDDPAARGLVNAFVYLEKLDAENNESVEDSPSAAANPEPVRMDQAGFQFRPQVQVVQVGQGLIFGNSDFQNHNVRGNSENPKNLFNVIMKHDRKVTKHFQYQGETSPIKITCDFHPGMEAWVYVIDHPRYAVTSGDGAFEIGAVEPGRYRLHVTQPLKRVRAETDVELVPGDRVDARVTFGIANRYYRASPPVKISRPAP
jgi:plastocyanin